ncbi:MAG: histidine phosphatase family protein [Cyclobacteriaceae bacterium]|nr:histidine phosphatase family protein [Cyclobacteriaceae bacterium]
MELKKIYLIRHGQTGHNHRGIVQGRYVNSKLSKKGYKQAAAFFEAYKDVSFQKVYTSTLQRTKQTIQQFLDLGLPYEELPGLDEICWGESEGLFADGENNKKYYDIINTWKSGNLNPRLEGGENPLDVQKRQEEALSYIASQPEDLVLVCMHGRALKIMLAWITGLHMKDMDSFDHDNLSLYILDYENNKWIIDAHDERDHLDNIKI